MFAIGFDLLVHQTRASHPKSVPQAYADVGAVLNRDGFTLVQGSVYVSQDDSLVNDGGYVAFNSETGTTTQGETVDEALADLREAVELFLEDEPMTFAGPPLMTTVTIKGHA